MRHPALAVALTVAVAAALVPHAGATGRAQADPPGRELFLTGCASCHGDQGEGVSGRGPSLVAAGRAAAYYYLTTGRMPLANAEHTPERKPPAYSRDEIDLLVDYVGTLGSGVDIPRVDVDAGGLAEGGELFRANCAPCHGAAGVGGALSYGREAPNIHPATPTQIASAVRVGPGQMPVFGSEVFDQHQLDSLVRYVQYLDQPDDRGGLPLGRTGPIPEGFVTWVIGVGALLGAVAWIGTRREEGDGEPEGEAA